MQRVFKSLFGGHSENEVLEGGELEGGVRGMGAFFLALAALVTSRQVEAHGLPPQLALVETMHNIEHSAASPQNYALTGLSSGEVKSISEGILGSGYPNHLALNFTLREAETVVETSSGDLTSSGIVAYRPRTEPEPWVNHGNRSIVLSSLRNATGNETLVPGVATFYPSGTFINFGLPNGAEIGRYIPFHPIDFSSILTTFHRAARSLGSSAVVREEVSTIENALPFRPSGNSTDDRIVVREAAGNFQVARGRGGTGSTNSSFYQEGRGIDLTPQSLIALLVASGVTAGVATSVVREIEHRSNSPGLVPTVSRTLLQEAEEVIEEVVTAPVRAAGTILRAAERTAAGILKSTPVVGKTATKVIEQVPILGRTVKPGEARARAVLLAREAEGRGRSPFKAEPKTRARSASACKDRQCKCKTKNGTGPRCLNLAVSNGLCSKHQDCPVKNQVK